METDNKKDEYSRRVNELIKELYTDSEEFALLRQRDEKPEEFEAYRAACERCKAQARTEIYGEDNL